MAEPWEGEGLGRQQGNPSSSHATAWAPPSPSGRRNFDPPAESTAPYSAALIAAPASSAAWSTAGETSPMM
jgi:hypothetical protein